MHITGVILAGGRGSRMGGRDKGLLTLDGTPLIERLIERLRPQVDALLISANRNQARYAAYGYPVLADADDAYAGPLAGLAAALAHIDTPYALTVPCDAPFLPPDYAARMLQAHQAADAALTVAGDGQRLQPVYCLAARSLAPDLDAYLRAGQRRAETWIRRQAFVEADFSDLEDMFVNLNTPAQWAALQQP